MVFLLFKFPYKINSIKIFQNLLLHHTIMWLQTLVISSLLVTEIFQIFLILLPFRALCMLAPSLRIWKMKADIGHFGLHVPASIPPGCLLGTLLCHSQGVWVRLTPSQATRDNPRACHPWEWVTWGQAPTKSQSHQSQSVVLSFNFWERETLIWLRLLSCKDISERVQPAVNKLSPCQRVAGSKAREPLRKQES